MNQLNPTHDFSFEEHPSKKGTCPNCNKKGCFRYYKNLPREYGICDHKNKCNYHNNPFNEGMEVKRELYKNVESDKVILNKKADKIIIYPSSEYLDIIKDVVTPFHNALAELNIPNDHLIKWGVGGEIIKNKEEVITCFVYQSSKKVLNVKKISYLPSGKRNKVSSPFYLYSKNKEEKYSLCLFGEHLLSSDKIICFVESEKTAIVASHFYPEFDWLSSGSANGLTNDKIEVLYNRKIYYLCDADKAGRNSSSLKKLKSFGLNYITIDLFPEREDGYDLADAIFDGKYPEIEPVASFDNDLEQVQKKRKIISEFERVENFLSDRYDIRFNEVSNEVEYRIKSISNIFIPLNENNLYRELHKNFINFSQSKLTALLLSDFVEKYNPFLDYFENLLKWNAETDQDHINKLCEYIPVKKEDKERFNRHFKKMLVRCIACSLTPVFNKQAFIFTQEMQNSGKSTFCRWLCPPALSSYIAENINMDKDSLIALTDNFLINMDELATMSRAEINQLKAFMSKDVVKVRPPYGKKAILMNRRANFVGSTNKSEFLNDETGSVRWLCFELCDKINFDYKTDIDINNIWSQAYALFKSGFKYELTSEEVAENEEINKAYRITTLEQELIQAKYRPATKDDVGSKFYTATSLMQEIEFNNPGTKVNHINIGKTLKMLGFKKEGSYNGQFMVKGYWIIT